jgi:ribosome recycling factor
MEQTLEGVMQSGYENMHHSIEHLKEELSNVRAGKAHPGMVASIKVDYYGTPTLINQVANVSNSDAKTLAIQPWEKKLIPAIERAIFEANIGITPMNNGEVITLTVPPVTEERRKDMVKTCKALGEDAKVSIRNTRHKLMDTIKKQVKDGYPEDAGKKKEAEVQKTVDTKIEMIDKLVAAKEKEIMTV